MHAAVVVANVREMERLPACVRSVVVVNAQEKVVVACRHDGNYQ